MSKKFWLWLIWFVFLLVLNFTVPFTALSDVPLLQGSFLFWTIWAIVAIVSMFVMFLGWREPDRKTSSQGEMS